ncbi:MAG: DinB family protein [Gemmatimonadaceae bacterium]
MKRSDAMNGKGQQSTPATEPTAGEKQMPGKKGRGKKQGGGEREAPVAMASVTTQGPTAATTGGATVSDATASTFSSESMVAEHPPAVVPPVATGAATTGAATSGAAANGAATTGASANGNASSAPDREVLLAAYTDAPRRLRDVVRGLSAEQLATPRPDGGWSITQVAVSLSDAELNAIGRVRRILAEPGSTLQPYDQDRWAGALTATTSLDTALDLFTALRRAGAEIFREATPEQRALVCVHPERGATTLDDVLTIHAWHADARVREIEEFRSAKGW